MAFLYSSYIVTNAILSSLLGKVFDKDFQQHGNILHALKTVGGYESFNTCPSFSMLRFIASVQFSIASAIILCATFIPIGAFALNPEALGVVGSKLHNLESGSSEEADSENGENYFKKGAYPDTPVLEKISS